jgi:hypothetical protein
MAGLRLSIFDLALAVCRVSTIEASVCRDSSDLKWFLEVFQEKL